MKQRHSVLSILQLRIFSPMLVLGCVSCAKPPMFHITARNELPVASDHFKIFLEGRELGTITGSGTLEFDAEGRRGDSLEQAQPQGLEAKSPWVCGWVKADSVLRLANFDEIERARAEHRAIRATMSLTSMPPAFEWVHIFVDNRGGPTQTISIGELQQQVSAGATEHVMLPHSDGCDKANDVRLNGTVVAPIDTHKTLLIDISQTHCYRDEWAGYGFDDSGHSKTIYQPRPFQLLANNPDFFMEPLPGTVMTSQMGTTRDTLKEIACPKGR